MFSGLQDKAHVLKVKDELYNAVLGMVDLVKGTNSYYKLQLLEADASKRSESASLFQKHLFKKFCESNNLSMHSCLFVAINVYVQILHESVNHEWKY